MKTHYSRQNRTVRIIGTYEEDQQLLDEIARAQAQDEPVKIDFEDEKLCGDVKTLNLSYDRTHGQPEWLAELKNVNEIDS